ncbi:MAG TPA: glycosyltransferase family 2 protein [Bryobacteraceae bacterium]|nr:glycosyltransferase family 2 protein [Bryobacteraceae bacterium]
MASAGTVIVTHNSAAVIGECLKALDGLRAIVVDNASCDDTVACVTGYPNVTVIANPENRGFAAAVNQGFAHLDRELILILNPDAVLLSDLEPLAEACRRSGLAAGRLVDAGGCTQTGFTIRRFPTPWTLVFEALGLNRLWPANPVNRRYRYLDRNQEEPGPVDQPAGAFLMVWRDVWEQCGGFDEEFFPVWFEDVDFCRRANQAGFVAEYVPAVMARHLGGHSVSRIPSPCRTLYWYVSLLKYASKHFQRVPSKGVAVAVLLGAVPRAMTGIILERSLNPLGVYWQVARLGWRHLFAGRAQQCSGVENADNKPRLSPLIGGK